MAKKKSYLKQIYKYDESEKCYVVEVSLETYQELFNEWDAAPTRKKDLNSELIDFIEQAAYEIPMKSKVKISFGIPLDQKDEKLEASSKTAIYHNFKIIIHFINKTLRVNNRKVLTYLSFALSFITLSYLTISFIVDNLGFTIIREGLMIGGWFLMWESFSLFFFDSYEVRNRRKRYQRFLDSDIEFRYIDHEKTDHIETTNT
jgi:hypothetical protein